MANYHIDTLEERKEKRNITMGMAAYFFDVSRIAFAMRMQRGLYTDKNGDQLEFQRNNPNSPRSGRRFSLDELREIAHSLRRSSFINDRQLKVIITRIDAFSIPVKSRRFFNR